MKQELLNIKNRLVALWWLHITCGHPFLLYARHELILMGASP